MYFSGDKLSSWENFYEFIYIIFNKKKNTKA